MYKSTAWFTADENGCLDLSRQKPDSGRYDFIDPMGPIVSVRSQEPKALDQIAQNISVNESIFIDISAECGQDHNIAGPASRSDLKNKDHEFIMVL